MNRMDRLYGTTSGGAESWRLGDPLFASYEEYGPYGGSYEPYAGRYAGPGGYGPAFGYGEHDRTFASGFDESGYARRSERGQGGEHVWRGGVLGWLGSGLRAGAAWLGNQMQGWGALLGGKLRGGSEELGRAMKGRGEQVGTALERRGEETPRPSRTGFRGRPPRSYRRPDDRILDDVQQRVASAPIDADEVEIEVNDGVVKLSGRVPRRFDKRVIEELAEQVFGVQEVQNQVRLARPVEEKGARSGAARIGGGNGQGGLDQAPEART